MTKLTDDEKRKIVEYSDDDTPHIRSMKSELQLVYAMPLDERKVFYAEQAVADDERYLQWMVDINKSDDDNASYFVRRAKKHVSDYQTFGDEADLEGAELCAEIAKGTKDNKFTIADIRKQRERIQWQKTKLKKLISPPTEPTQSSSHSKT